MSISKFSRKLETHIWGQTKKEFELIEKSETEKPAVIARMLIHLGMNEYDKNRGINKKTN